MVPLGDKNFSSHAHKTESWYLLGILFKMTDEHPRLFYIGVPPPPGIQPRSKFNDEGGDYVDSVKKSVTWIPSSDKEPYN